MQPLVRTLTALAVAAGILGAPTPASASSPEPVRAITWNVCGAVCAKGATEPLTAQTVRAVRAWSADVLLLQEVCAPQFAALRAALRGYSGTFKAQTRSARCGGSGKHGIAVFVRGSATAARWRNLGGAEARTGYEFFLLEVDGRTRSGRPYTAATAHLRVKCDPGYVRETCAPIVAAARAAQVAAIADRLDVLVRAGRPVVLGGDLNMRATDAPMSRLYADGSGLFREADGGTSRGGEPTDCMGTVKIDYVFYSAAASSRLDGDAAACAPAPVSDHRLLRAVAYLR